VAVAATGGGKAGIVHLFPLSLLLFIVSSFILSCGEIPLLAIWGKLHSGVILILYLRLHLRPLINIYPRRIPSSTTTITHCHNIQSTFVPIESHKPHNHGRQSERPWLKQLASAPLHCAKLANPKLRGPCYAIQGCARYIDFSRNGHVGSGGSAALGENLHSKECWA